jgi:hypothetical protein
MSVIRAVLPRAYCCKREPNYARWRQPTTAASHQRSTPRGGDDGDQTEEGLETDVTVHVGHLRQKLEDDPSRPRRLVTVRGVGYRFDP